MEPERDTSPSAQEITSLVHQHIDTRPPTDFGHFFQRMMEAAGPRARKRLATLLAWDPPRFPFDRLSTPILSYCMTFLCWERVPRLATVSRVFASAVRCPTSITHVTIGGHPSRFRYLLTHYRIVSLSLVPRTFVWKDSTRPLLPLNVPPPSSLARVHLHGLPNDPYAIGLAVVQAWKPGVAVSMDRHVPLSEWNQMGSNQEFVIRTGLGWSVSPPDTQAVPPCATSICFPNVYGFGMANLQGIVDRLPPHVTRLHLRVATSHDLHVLVLPNSIRTIRIDGLGSWLQVESKAGLNKVQSERLVAWSAQGTIHSFGWTWPKHSNPHVTRLHLKRTVQSLFSRLPHLSWLSTCIDPEEDNPTDLPSLTDVDLTLCSTKTVRAVLHRFRNVPSVRRVWANHDPDEPFSFTLYPFKVIVL